MEIKQEIDNFIKRVEKENPDLALMLKSVYLYNNQFSLRLNIEKNLLKVIKAMAEVDRIFFVPDILKDRAYEDIALAIPENQTISQPSTVSRMILMADIRPNQKILEVGSGSGYNAALLAYLSKSEIITIEKIKELVKFSKANIKRLEKFKKLNLKIKVLKKDFFSCRLKQKFDRIIFTAGLEKNEAKIRKKIEFLLNENGIAILPRVNGPMIIFKKIKNNLIKTETEDSYVFVPLTEK